MTVYSVNPIFLIKGGKIVGRLRRPGNATWVSKIHLIDPTPHNRHGTFCRKRKGVKGQEVVDVIRQGDKIKRMQVEKS